MLSKRYSLGSFAVFPNSKMVISNIKGTQFEGNGLDKKVKTAEITKFYAGKTIFVTGGTGFLGKVLIEKLLHSCDVKKIYMLVRDKKGLSAQQRTENFFNDVIFEKLRKEKPEALQKVKAIAGDLTANSLGFDDKLKQDIVENVSVVFHSAATVKFFESIRKALAINVHGTQQVLALSHEMKKVEAFVHVSTAFSNTNQKLIEEKVYPPPMRIEDVYDFLKTHDETEDIQELIGDRPNTYTFTKAIAEYEIMTKRGNIPACVIRPAIVTSVSKEPLPGWLANWNGPSWLFYMATKGFFRLQPGDEANDCNIVPVDYISNGMIVAATRCQKSNELKVYNFCSSPRNAISYRRATTSFINAGFFRRDNILPCPRITMMKTIWLVNIIQFFILSIPAFIADLYLRLIGKTPRFMKMEKLMKELARVNTFATSNQWDYKDDNTKDLHASMSSEDQRLFYCDLAEVDWNVYMDVFYLGVKKYLATKDT